MASANSTPDRPPVPLHEDHTFRGLVMAGSAAGLGSLVASLTTLRQGEFGFEFHWTFFAIPAFVAGAIIACLYWWLVFRFSAQAAAGGGRRLVWISSLALLGLSVVAFLYPIRFIPESKRGDVIVGLSAAVVVLGGIGYLIHTIVRWLEQDSEETAAEERRPD